MAADQLYKSAPAKVFGNNAGFCFLNYNEFLGKISSNRHDKFTAYSELFNKGLRNFSSACSYNNTIKRAFLAPTKSAIRVFCYNVVIF